MTQHTLKPFTVVGVLCAALLLASAAFADPCPSLTDGNAGCNLIITATDNGSGGVSYAITAGSLGVPYEFSDDQAVGVVNNSSQSISSISLFGTDIFGFEDDGIQLYLSTETCPSGTTTYEGIINGTSNCVTFNVTDFDHGSVIFNGGLGAGQTAYFSLEGAPNINNLRVGVVPEPASLTLLGTGLFGLLVRRRKSRRSDSTSTAV